MLPQTASDNKADKRFMDGVLLRYFSLGYPSSRVNVSDIYNVRSGEFDVATLFAKMMRGVLKSPLFYSVVDILALRSSKYMGGVDARRGIARMAGEHILPNSAMLILIKKAIYHRHLSGKINDSVFMFPALADLCPSPEPATASPLDEINLIKDSLKDFMTHNKRIITRYMTWCK